MVDWLKAANLFFFFLSGSIWPILSNAVLNNPTAWDNGLEMQFKQPWFLNFVQCLGMCVFLLPKLLTKGEKCVSPHKSPSWLMFRSVMFPSLLSIFAVALQNYSLIYMPTSIWQVFHGFQALFTTLFAATYRHQELFLVDWLGIFVSVSGICFSGVAAMLRGMSANSDSLGEIFWAFILAIVSHGVKSFQTIIEEQLLHDDDAKEANMTGYEGIWGIYIIGLICLPIANMLEPTAGIGWYENTGEAFKMLGLSGSLLTFLLFYIVAVSIFMYTGIAVTKDSTAIHRNLYETVRPFPVWIISIIVYKFTNNSYIGEKLDNYSIIEGVGFILSVIGSLIYNKVIRIPCLTYEGEESGSLSSIQKSLIDK